MIRRTALLLALALPSAANPVLDGADPHVAFFKDRFWLYPTEPRAERPIFAAYSSSDLLDWKREKTILDLTDIPWIKDDGAPRHHPWAPAIVEKNGTFFFYYSVGPQNPTPSRIGVAIGPSPAGPFKDLGKPLLTGDDRFEAIDPMVFINPADGKSWLYAGGSYGSRLRVFELGPDMTSILREAAIEQPPHFTEAPFIHLRNGTYYLSYSHGRWNDTTYSVHYATSASPVGPWTYRGKILSSDETRKGPGHHAFVAKPGTDDWFIVYHRWENPSAGPPFRGQRKIAVEKISYSPEGFILPITMTSGSP